MVDSTGSAPSGGGTELGSDSPGSAPVVEAPAAADTRPSSWAEALADAPAEDPAPSAPSDQPALVPPPEAAIPPPSEAPVETSPDGKTPGPLPFERHKAIVENTRAKAVESTIQQVKDTYGAGIDFQTRFDADPVGTFSQIFDGLTQHPEFGPAILSHAARALSAQRGKAALDEEPGPDLQSADGTLLYSADQLAKREAWHRRQIQADMAKALTPFQQREQALQQQQAFEEAKAAAGQRMGKLYDAFAARPHFTAHKAAITDRFKAIRAEYPDMDLGAALGMAYADVVETKVVPSQQQQVVASAVAKATGRSTPPGTVTSQPPGRPRTMREALEQAGL